MPKLVTWMNNQRVGELTKLANGAHTFKYAPEWLASRYARPLSLSSEIWGLVVVNEHDNHDRQRLDSSLVYTGAHNVYYVKSCLSDAKCFSGSRYSFRVQELKPLLFHNWPVHGEIAWLFPAPC